MTNRTVSLLKRKNYAGILYILPWILGFTLFQLFPFARSLVYSFTNIRMTGENVFIGLSNYRRALSTDPNFPIAVGVTLKYLLLALPAKIIFALLIAMILNRRVRGIGFFRAAYYLPSILGGSVAISALWRVMFASNGVINNMLSVVGVEGIRWLGNPSYSLMTISLIEVWQFGSSMVLFLAALKQVPQSVYDSASVDGATKIRQFVSITLPMISPVLFFNIIMQTINLLQNFTAAFVVTGGGPLKSTYVIAMKLYEDAFKNFSMGYACAQSWIVFVAVGIVTVLYFKASNRWVYYSDGK